MAGNRSRGRAHHGGRGRWRCGGIALELHDPILQPLPSRLHAPVAEITEFLQFLPHDPAWTNPRVHDQCQQAQHALG